jgi:hypothetical protein
MSQAGCKVTGEIADLLTVGTTDLDGIGVIAIIWLHLQPYAVAYLQNGNDLLPTFEAYAYNFGRDYPGVNVGLWIRCRQL